MAVLIALIILTVMVMVNGETKPINKLSEIMFGVESVPPRGYKLARIG